MGWGALEQKRGGSSVFEPSNRGGLCSFDPHIGGGSSYTLSYKKIVSGIHQYKLVSFLM